MAGFDVGPIIRHPVFLVTFGISIPAWVIAFAGQCAAEAKLGFVNGTPVVKYLWYSIWVQLAVVVLLFFALATDTLAVHRFQLVIFLAIAEVFAVYGTDFIFSSNGALIAVGVGWLLTAMVNLVWIIYLTSEEESFLHHLLNSAGNGGLSGFSRAPRRESAAAFVGGENGISNYGGGGIGGGIGGGYSSTPTRPINGSGYSGGGYAPAATDSATPQKAAGAGFNNSPPASEENQAIYKYRARAMYSYTSDPSDPNEVSFNKGDILDVQDTTGKWYQVRTPTGAAGIAPSNYLTIL